MEAKLEKSLKTIRSKTDFKPKVALVLGSGLGDYAETIDVAGSVDYSDIEGFPVSTVAGHRGRYIFGHVGKVPVVIMQGRVHFYEGYPIGDVVMPIRLMGLLGAEVLFLTNACGAINTSFAPGDFMMIRDHIIMGVPSPLAGPNIDALGPRFPDMSTIYDGELRRKIRSASAGLGLTLEEGVYIQAPGPQYEDARGDPCLRHPGRRRGRHEHGLRGRCRVPYGDDGLRHLLRVQHGGRYLQKQAVPRGGPGDDGPRRTAL